MFGRNYFFFPVDKINEHSTRPCIVFCTHIHKAKKRINYLYTSFRSSFNDANNQGNIISEFRQNVHSPVIQRR